MRTHRTPRGSNSRSPVLKVEALEDRSLLSLSGNSLVAEGLVLNEAGVARAPLMALVQEQVIGNPPLSGKAPAIGLPLVLESFVVVEFVDRSVPSMPAAPTNWNPSRSEKVDPDGSVEPVRWSGPSLPLLYEVPSLERGRPNYGSNPLRPPVPAGSTDTVPVFSAPAANEARRVAPMSFGEPAGDAGTARMVTLTPAAESRIRPPPINIGVPLPSDGHSGSSLDAGQGRYFYRAIAATSAEPAGTYKFVYATESSSLAEDEDTADQAILPALSGGMPSNIFSVDVASLERAIDGFVEDVSDMTPASVPQSARASYAGWFVAGIIATAVGLELQRRRPGSPLVSLDPDADCDRLPNLSDFRTDSCL
jgi:hypothetical protein